MNRHCIRLNISGQRAVIIHSVWWIDEIQNAAFKLWNWPECSNILYEFDEIPFVLFIFCFIVSKYAIWMDQIQRGCQLKPNVSFRAERTRRRRLNWIDTSENGFRSIRITLRMLYNFEWLNVVFGVAMASGLMAPDSLETANKMLHLHDNIMNSISAWITGVTD